MSIVLYALGLGLFAWSAMMAFAGDTFAAIDIAASLAGWGAFTIGLGALTGAIGRLTRVLAAREANPVVIRTEPAAPEYAPASSVVAAIDAPPASYAPEGAAEPSPSVPDFAPEPQSATAPDFRAEPSFEPASRRKPPQAYESRLSFGPRFTRARPAQEPSVDLQPEPVPTPDPLPRPEPTREYDPEPAPEPAPQADASERELASAENDRSEKEPPELSRSDRRAMRIKARQERLAERIEPAIEAPRAVAPLLGGGLAGRRRLNVDLAPDQSGQGATASAETTEPMSAEPSAHPIMPLRVRAEEPRFQEIAATVPEVESAGIEPESEPVVEAEAEASAETPEPGPASTPEAVAPKVPEWLARARARRQSRIEPTPEPVPEPTATPEPEIVPAPDATLASEATLEPKPEPATESFSGEDVAAAFSGPQVIREGEHNGVLYRFYEDGSVEAATSHGSRRFASIDELRRTVMAARGPAAILETQPEPEVDAPNASPESEAAPARPDEEPDPLDAALAELEGKITSETPGPNDRPAR